MKSGIDLCFPKCSYAFWETIITGCPLPPEQATSECALDVMYFHEVFKTRFTNSKCYFSVTSPKQFYFFAALMVKLIPKQFYPKKLIVLNSTKIRDLEKTYPAFFWNHEDEQRFAYLLKLGVATPKNERLISRYYNWALGTYSGKMWMVRNRISGPYFPPENKNQDRDAERVAFLEGVLKDGFTLELIEFKKLLEKSKFNEIFRKSKEFKWINFLFVISKAFKIPIEQSPLVWKFCNLVSRVLYPIFPRAATEIQGELTPGFENENFPCLPDVPIEVPSKRRRVEMEITMISLYRKKYKPTCISHLGKRAGDTLDELGWRTRVLEKIDVTGCFKNSVQGYTSGLQVRTLIQMIFFLVQTPPTTSSPLPGSLGSDSTSPALKEAP